jgi:hypothetical protein
MNNMKSVITGSGIGIPKNVVPNDKLVEFILRTLSEAKRPKDLVPTCAAHMGARPFGRLRGLRIN